MLHIKKTLKHPKAKEEERLLFQTKIANYKKEGIAIIPIDESGFVHSAPRTHGYSIKGNRCYGVHDWHSTKRINAIGALMGKQLLTVSLFQSNINTSVFNHWVEQDLIPKLSQKSVLVMDNAKFHKSLELKNIIEKAGHKLEYLPAYSPDLNPIEKKWAQAKSKRRKYRCNVDTLFQQYIL